MGGRDRKMVRRDLRVLEVIQASLDRREEILAIVDSSEDPAEAQERIGALLEIGDPDASWAVLDIQLSQWTRSGRKSINERAQELRHLLGESTA